MFFPNFLVKLQPQCSLHTTFETTIFIVCDFYMRCIFVYTNMPVIGRHYNCFHCTRIPKFLKHYSHRTQHYNCTDKAGAINICKRTSFQCISITGLSMVQLIATGSRVLHHTKSKFHSFHIGQHFKPVPSCPTFAATKQPLHYPQHDPLPQSQPFQSFRRTITIQ